MRISDWSSDVCSSDLLPARFGKLPRGFRPGETAADDMNVVGTHGLALGIVGKTRQVVLQRGGEEPMRGLLWAALVAGAIYCLEEGSGWSGPGVCAWKGAESGRGHVCTPVHTMNHGCRHPT